MARKALPPSGQPPRDWLKPEDVAEVVVALVAGRRRARSGAAIKL